MKKRFFFLCLVPLVLFSQKETSSKAFDSIFYDIAINISSSNPIKALHLSDSLFINSKNVKQKLKSLMLTADILAKQEKRGEAIMYAQQALEIAIAEKDYNFKSRIYGFLSTQYRLIGFLDKGKKFLNKGIEASEQMSDKEQVIKYRALGYQEMAEYDLVDENYKKAIEHLKLANHAYQKEDNIQLKHFTLANVEEMIARSYNQLGEVEKEMMHLSRANMLINKADAGSSLWAALIYRRLGFAFLQSKTIDSAGVFLNKALVISEKSNHGSLKEKIYKDLGDYYKQKQDLDSVVYYNAKYDAVLTENTLKKKHMINSAYNMLKVEPKQVTSNIKFYVIIGGLCLLLILGVYHNRKNIFHSLKINNADGNDNSAEVLLSKKTKKELLKKLEAFEASNQFLDKNMSLSTLVGELNTNAKYLRPILKFEKHTDYNSYINELRIKYIVEKLKTNPEYLNYKISYLAEESGFSSHSKFSASFKNITGLCPSKFIEDLEANTD